MIDSPLTLPCGATLKNRIVKSAMSEALADEANDPTDALIALYRRWSEGGAALLVTGNVPIDRWHLEHAGNVVLDAASDRNRAALLAQAAKSAGALVLAQLSHAGRQTPLAINPNPLSISDVQLELPGYGAPRPATEEELLAVTEQFAASAGIARDCGFDGVEIHSAHGYLLSSSLSPRINTRNDRWGGALENRARLLVAVVRAVRERVGPDFVVAVKLNSSDFQKGGFDHADSIRVARMIEQEGVDFIEVSGGNFESPTAYQHSPTAESSKAREAYFLVYAKETKAALRIPVMVTGGFRSAATMNSAVEAGATDLIGIGRPFVIDPAFPAKLLRGEIDAAPAVERDFPPAAELPKGAVLNWFCDQLTLQNDLGGVDPTVSLLAGHQRYIERIDAVTDRLLKARMASAPTRTPAGTADSTHSIDDQ
jgi:2,4-dienoyl-CoA reductase-like NADH-dependent reductase (Old Yellow Enzyme family)